MLRKEVKQTARTAKRYLGGQKSEDLGLPIYKTAIYARVSVDHDDKKSESIEKQVELLKEWIRRQNEDPGEKGEFILYDVYTDLGKTGTNFARPGFERLMKDIRAGQVHCIMVKDFSRFGRNYIETGDYLEKVFPAWKVRFISVCDHYDSFAEHADSQALSVHLKNLVNEVYAKDISVKSCASRRAAQKKGSYVGGIAPYGYRSVKESGTRKLVIDPEAAEIVRRIFRQYTDGASVTQIIEGLFADGVHRIRDYHTCHHVYCQEGEVLYQWGDSSVRAVLSGKHYYGDLVQHRYESRFSGGGKGCRLLEEKEWIVTSQAHTPIVDRDMYERAKIRLNAAKRAGICTGWKADERAFYGVIYCGDCGRKMAASRTRGYTEYFCRASRYKDERKCAVKNISEEKLQKMVRYELLRQLRFLKIRKQQLSAISEDVLKGKLAGIQKDLDKMETDYRKIADQSVRAFLMYKEGKASLQAYLDAKKACSDWNSFLMQRKQFLEQNMRMMQKKQKEEEKFLGNFLESEENVRMNAQMADAFLERICLYGDGRLEILFRFQEARDE